MTSPAAAIAKRWIASAVSILALASGSLLLAPTAKSDSADSFRAAVSAVRAASSCEPLQYNAIADKVAVIINRSLSDYLDHVADDVPLEDALPGLHDLGYRGTKGKLLSGQAPVDGNSIKGAVVQGYKDIPDCSYTDFGVNVLRNDRTGKVLAALVLAGP
ncbi:hypothetical protein [Mycobacterium arosiense]|uniref:CAP domain-containing protein n=1 Tax=Mycobacterium arosiense ATCC BAA-1401 = DSM 45069 TaxID=1265311 RepID=A0A1W9ZCW0_MYCAI|nr:hypothetical protein [Mycobacterium arosiense]ORA11963.1 hypothetical protein BST14_17775 [Mycobacterium arosiense ATCC BAA-1401 = DSM 45069]